MNKKRVVVMGGGNGGSMSIRALKQYLDSIEMSAVIPMSDSGASSGRLRDELGVLPPGDILRAILAMSRYDYDLLRRIFYETRFSEHGKLQGFGLGHLFIGLSEKYSGSVLDPVRALAQAVDVVGPVFPATLESTDLHAELEDGTVLDNEHTIDRPKAAHQSPIKKVWLDPSVPAYPRAVQEIHNADYIIIGPGSFYTSLIATLLVDGIAEAITSSKANIIFVSANIRESDGEIGPMTLSETVHTLAHYLGAYPHTILSNTVEHTAAQQAYYDEKGWEAMRVDVDQIKETTIMHKALEHPTGGLDHKKLGACIADAMNIM